MRDRKEAFMPVEITGGWVRAEKGIGARIVLGVVCAGVPSVGLRVNPSAPLRTS